MKATLFHYKHAVLTVLDLLLKGLLDCEEVGFLDPDDVLYNRIFDLLEDAKAAEDLLELKEVVEEAKQVESFLEAWVERNGMSSLALEWPSLPEEG